MVGDGESIFRNFARSASADTTNVVRSRVIQDELARRLKEDPRLQVVNIGCGFDSRAYRLPGGRWFEFDEPAVIAHKNARVAVEACVNQLRRFPVDFAKGELREALRQCDPNANTVVVVEGVFMYLDTSQVGELLKTIRDAFPDSTLICDLMDETFFTRYVKGKLYRQILALGGEFKLIEANPENLFLSDGYTLSDEPISLVNRARELKVLRVPPFILRTALRSLRDGYRVHIFRVPPVPDRSASTTS